LKLLNLPKKYESSKFEPLSDLTILKDEAFVNGVLKSGLVATVERQHQLKKDILEFNEGRVIPFSAFIYGGTGVGKTQMLCGYGKEVIENGFTAVFVTAERFYELWADKISSSRYAVESASRELNRINGCDLLIIDDVAKHNVKSGEVLSGFEFKKLTNLLDDRHNNMKETILTSNRSAKEFLEIIGDRQASRIKDGSFFGFSFDATCEDIRPMLKRVVRW